MSKWIVILVLTTITYVFPNTHDHKETPIQPASILGAKDIQITSHPLCEYPDIAIDKDKNIWIVYTEIKRDNEYIKLKKIINEQVVDSFVVSTHSGMEYKPRIVCDKTNRVWIVWSAKRNNNWDIYARSIKNREFSKELQITTHPDVDINPEIAVSSNGEIIAVWESLRNNNFDIFAVKFNKSHIFNPIAVSTSKEMDLRPVIAIDKKGNQFVTWDRQQFGGYTVLLKQLDKENAGEIEISSQKGFNQCPYLTFDKNNILTIAYQSDLTPSGNIGITPWIYIKKFKDLKTIESFTTASPGDWVKNYEDQGFEFPIIGYNSDNRMWLTGRPSQGFFIQNIDGKNSSDLYKINKSGWGGRGKQARFLFDDNDTMYSVRRDIKYIYLNILPGDNNNIQLPNHVQDIKFDSTFLINKKSKNNNSSQTLDKRYHILFGDIHQHSWLSDGMGTADACYTRSKYRYEYDFAALTDHEWFVKNLLMPSEWEWIKIISKCFNNDSDFITFSAYEWTSPRLPKGFGHKNVFFFDWDIPIFSLKSEAKNTKNLFNLLNGENAFAIPHHIGWTGIDWENHDELTQPDFEIVSAHGAFEYMGNEPINHRGGMPGYFVQDGLAKGLKFGFTGSSDGHGLRWHHGIARKLDEWQTGLTGVLVKEKSRKAIFEALQKRHVYATSGVPIQIDFRINDNIMGKEIFISSPPEIQINVKGTNKIHYVILLRDNKEIAYFGKDFDFGNGVRKKIIDDSIETGNHWYYLRIIQEDGEMAWSSPIWVEYKK